MKQINLVGGRHDGAIADMREPLPRCILVTEAADGEQQGKLKITYYFQSTDDELTYELMREMEQ